MTAENWKGVAGSTEVNLLYTVTRTNDLIRYDAMQMSKIVIWRYHLEDFPLLSVTACQAEYQPIFPKDSPLT